jgi:acetoin utilization deacetylase AcuC-like enzyme
LAHLNFTERAYEHFGRQIGEYARAFSKGRVLSVLEGGYFLPELGNLCMAYVEGLVDAL